VSLRICNALETTPDRILIGTVKQPDSSKMDNALFDKFQKLSPENQRLCFAFMDLLNDGFNS